MLDKHGVQCKIEDVISSGQKEVRIIDSLEPIIGIHRLVINSSCLLHDIETTKHYPNEQRSSYSWVYQLSRITRDKDALKHDDRVEALAQGCKFLHELIKIDAQKEEARKTHAKQLQFITDPNGIFRKANIRRYASDGTPIQHIGGNYNIKDRFRR
jgi:hypothetical protein